MSKIVEVLVSHSSLRYNMVHNTIPLFNESVYRLRIKSLLQLASSQDYTHLIIYGDREHCSNIHF